MFKGLYCKIRPANSSLVEPNRLTATQYNIFGLLTLLVLLMWGNIASAQTRLVDAVLQASEIDPGVNALRQKVARASVEIESVKDGRLPQFSLSADTATTSVDGPAITLSVSQLLYDWGKIEASIRSASQDRIAAIAAMKTGLEQLNLDVAKFYIDVELLDQKLAHTAQYLTFAQRIATSAEDRALAGSGDNGEYARTRLEVIRTEERINQLTAERDLAMQQLSFLTGRSVKKISTAPMLNFAKRYRKGGELQAAVRFAPDYISAQAEVEKSEAEIDIARASRKPSIQLQAQLRSDIDRRDTRSSVGISTGVELGMGNLRGRQLEAARLSAEASKANLAGVSRNLSNAAQSAIQRITTLEASQIAQSRQLADADQVLQNYEQQFVAGQRQLVDLLTTGRDQYDAQIDSIETYGDLKRTEYEAAYDLGVLGTLIVENSK